MDNSVCTLYEARKIESKLEQQNMLGIVIPSFLVGVDAITKNNRFSQNDTKCNYYGRDHRKYNQNCLAFGKICDKCGQYNNFKSMCRSSEGSRYKSRYELRKRSGRTSKSVCKEINEGCQDDTGMEDLANQVQSFFYH